SIKVNGTAFQVTENLSTTLRCLRDTKHPRILWVDAICFGQSNNAEKNSQVRMMGDIYRLASHVLVFLGEGDHYSDVLLDFQGNVTHRVSLIQAIIQTVYRPWFRRTWTIQKYWLASSEPKIYLG
ncbi:heterokaryon incompatibility, partial [Clohesyomyces aquaticus]